MQETIQEVALWQQGLALLISALPPYHSLPQLHHPIGGDGGEATLMFTPFYNSALQLVPRANHSADNILQSLPSPSCASGKFIGLTDKSNRHYPIQYQVNHPSEAPPSYINSTAQENVVSNFHPFCQEGGIYPY